MVSDGVIRALILTAGSAGPGVLQVTGSLSADNGGMVSLSYNDPSNLFSVGSTLVNSGVTGNISALGGTINVSNTSQANSAGLNIQAAGSITAALFRATLIDQVNSWYQSLGEVQQPWMHGGAPVRCRITLIWSFYDCILSSIQKSEYTLAELAFSQATANLRKIPDVLLVFFRWYPKLK